MLHGTKEAQGIDVGNVVVVAGSFDVRPPAPFSASIRSRSEERDHEMRHERQKRGETKADASTALPKACWHLRHTTTMLRLFRITRQCTASSTP